MIITLPRYNGSTDSTLGLFFIDNNWECYTLEDEQRAVKVSGETRIDAGIYPVRFKEVLTPLTKKYRSKFDWFTWHLEIQEVKNFTNVYIHYGNDDDDTDACVLVGDSVNNNNLKSGFIGSSIQAYERIYKKISKALLNGEPVYIHIKDSAL